MRINHKFVELASEISECFPITFQDACKLLELVEQGRLPHSLIQAIDRGAVRYVLKVDSPHVHDIGTIPCHSFACAPCSHTHTETRLMQEVADEQ